MTDKKDENTNNTKTKSTIFPIISIICFFICVCLMMYGTIPSISHETELLSSVVASA